MKRNAKNELRKYILTNGSITRDKASELRLTVRLSERIREFEEEGMKFEKDWVYADGQRTTDFRYVLTERPKHIEHVQVEVNGIRMMRPVLV